MGDGQFDEWVASLGELQKLEFDTILPGHGRPMKGKAIIPAYQSYLTDLTNQVANLRKQGLHGRADRGACGPDVAQGGLPEYPASGRRSERRMAHVSVDGRAGQKMSQKVMLARTSDRWLCGVATLAAEFH